MNKRNVLVLEMISLFNAVVAQTFSGTGATIPDNGPAAYFPVIVTGVPASIDSSYGVESVCVTITHTNDYQLTIQLIAPDGSSINLSMHNGGTGNHYINTCFNQNATTSITAGSPPFTGSYSPQGILGNVNNGQNGNGLWQLVVQDHTPGTTGTLSNWSITFSNTPSLPWISSDLPLVFVNTNGLTILDDPKIPAQMDIIDNGIGLRNNLNDPSTFSSRIGIEVRGSWSQTFPQQQYGLETWDSLNLDIDTTVMGMPSESDWILNAPYNDKTCMRNALVYDIARKTGHYAPRTRFCELLLNNEYRGIYIMMEKIKRNANRVDISKLTPADTSGDALTGGYIIKIDKVTGAGGTGWNSNYIGFGTPIKFQYEYPEDVDMMPQQKLYIRSYVDSFERALNASWFLNPDSGYKNYIDLQSFVDYFILNETCKNVDAYRISTFLHKQKITKGGKLVIGPAWDYNIGFWNADYCQGNLYTGWQYQFNGICGTSGDNNVPFWWNKMMQDPAFTSLLKCRWDSLRTTTLNTDTLWNQIDSIALVLDEAKSRHFIKWPILGVQTWANPSPIPADYAGEISAMKGWIVNRMNWLDANMPGMCTIVNLEEKDFFNSNIYPNPAANSVTISYKLDATKNVVVQLYNVIGEKLLEHNYSHRQAGMNQIQLDDLSQYGKGIYFIKLIADGEESVKKLVIQ